MQYVREIYLIKILPQNYIKLRLKHQKLLDNFHFIEIFLHVEEEFLRAIEFYVVLNIVNGEYFINNKISERQKVLAEGAQGMHLDIDFGTFPFFTSSNTISAGVCTGLSVIAQKINEVLDVTKAYCTRVGGSPFPTELNDSIGEEPA